MSSLCKQQRRRFLKGSALAAVAAPTLISRAVLGQDGQGGANDKVTVGCIGMGKMMEGSHLSHFLRMPEVEVVAVCDVDTTRREHCVEKTNQAYGNGDCKGYNDYRELLARDDIDAVAVATPDHWHGTIIIDAAKAGKDIYCEKPLTNTIIEAKKCIDAVEQSGIIFQTGSQQRASDNFRFACELVRNGYIGDIEEVFVGVGGPSKWCDLPKEAMEPGLDWDRWLGPAPMRPYNAVLSPRGMHTHFPRWRNYREYGGGGMTDWGAHHFDIAQWGLGMDRSGPVKVVPPEKKDAGKGVIYYYDNGVKMTHGGEGGVTFVGTEGEVFVNRGKLRTKPESLMDQEIGDDQIHLYDVNGNSHGGHRQDWIDCVRERKQPICPIETGARTVTVCLLGNLAYWHDQELHWDPKKWRFQDGKGENAWLDYPYDRREGYELPDV